MSEQPLNETSTENSNESFETQKHEPSENTINSSSTSLSSTNSSTSTHSSSKSISSSETISVPETSLSSDLLSDSKPAPAPPELEEEEEVRTLFLAGLPYDTKEREIHNLFRPFNGYSGAVLRTTTKQPVAFATFIDQSSALSAKEALQGIHFDPNSSVKLCIELAKQNSRAKRVRESNPVQFFSVEQTEKRLKRTHSSTSDTQPSEYSSTGDLLDHSLHHHHVTSTNSALSSSTSPHLSSTTPTHHYTSTPTSSLGLSSSVYPSSTSSTATPSGINPSSLSIDHSLVDPSYHYSASLNSYYNLPVHGSGGSSTTALQAYYNDMALWNQSLVSQGYLPSDISSMGYSMNGSNVPGSGISVGGGSGGGPCNTLFVANLGPGTSEQELRDLFSRFPGFRRMKMNPKPGPTGGMVCFVEYQEANYSTHAMNALQSWTIRSSDRPGGMRIEYAKSRMGEMSQKTQNQPNPTVTH